MAFCRLTESNAPYLAKLASDRWKELRTKHNRAFMATGPGHFWDDYRSTSSYEDEVREISELRDFLGLGEEKKS